MDKIRIENLEIFAKHGVFPEENFLGQKFVLSAVLHTDTRKAGLTDELSYSALLPDGLSGGSYHQKTVGAHRSASGYRIGVDQPRLAYRLYRARLQYGGQGKIPERGG